jgi:broad specificity phosphatase PhoE
MFIEVMSDNEISLTENYHETAKTNPDYVGVSLEDATLDYRNRVAKYSINYEPLHNGKSASIESKWSYFKCDHSKRHFVVHNVSGNLQLKIVNFIMNLRTTSHPFYLSRHGQSEYNSVGRIGGDSSLSEHGIQYAHKLAKFVDETLVKDSNGKDVPARLWTSTLRRTKETAQFIEEYKILIKDRDDDEQEIEWVQMRPRAWHHLDELFAGSCDGMTYEEIEEEYPEEFSRRSVDKLAYRYPRGESYLDVIARLEPIIIEMERHREPLLIVGHQGILRIIYAFYMGLSRAEAPYVSIPLNTVIKLVPSAFGCSKERIILYHPPKVFTPDGQDEPHQNKNNIDPQSH